MANEINGEDKKLFLEAAKRMREVHKESKIKEFLQKCITTNETIHPSFGEVCYVPYRLCSPFSEARVIAIHIDDPELELVTDANEWRELERHSSRSLGVVEEDMFQRDSRTQDYTVWLEAQKQVVVPFKFRKKTPETVYCDTEAMRGHLSAVSPADEPSHSATRRQRVISVTFSAINTTGQRGPPLYVLEVDIRPRPFVVDHVFRFYHGKNDFLKRKIILDTSKDVGGCSWRGGAPQSGPSWQRNQKHLHCSNNAVVVGSSAASSDSDTQEVHIKYRCGEAGHEDSFYLLLYNDACHVALYEIWHVRVLALHRLDIQGMVGQTDRTAVMLRSNGGPLAVRGYSSAPGRLSLPEPARTLGPALSECPVDFHPLVPGRRDVLLHFVEEAPLDPQQNGSAAGPGMAGGVRPVSAWLLATVAKLPLLSRRYDIRLPLGRASNKKILYTNPYRRGAFGPMLTHPFGPMQAHPFAPCKQAHPLGPIKAQPFVTRH
jgi:nephrocystin-4